MFKRFLQMGCADPNKSYVGKPKDQSLPSLLNEAFKILEMRFANFDRDGASTLMYLELERELSNVGFRDGEKLAALFKRVDFDGNGTLDFAEFLSLLYLWAMNEKGDYSAFFKHPTNASLIRRVFEEMEALLIKYDIDKSRKLSSQELDALVGAEIPVAVKSGAYTTALEFVFPEQARKTGEEINFSVFMQLIYVMTCKLPGSSCKGTYITKRKVEASERFKSGKGEQSPLWKELMSAFRVLEIDFKSFDRDGDNLVDYTEITMGIPPSTSNYARLEILSRLEHAFSQVDVDASRTLDFYEYMYLGFMMTQNGSYHDLVPSSEGSAQVKKCFIDIHTYYRYYDADKNMRLTYDELQQFFMHLFGEVSPKLDAAFNTCKYQSSATQGRDAVDIVRFLKLLYMLVCPTGKFHPKVYDPDASKTSKPASRYIETISFSHANRMSKHPPRFTDVKVEKFIKGKLLGQGGQGTVHTGTYEDVVVAGKTFLGNPDASLVQEVLDEVRFFVKLDHPNCHYLLGAKTTLDRGGLMTLTEVCDNGSLFDLYCQKAKTFNISDGTALRIGKECAAGMQEIHRLGYMHRDLKSLNVFMDKDYVPKIADFGMVTDEENSTEPMGTPQWMAPEVISNYFGVETRYDKSCDVFSYGVLLWEIYHCKVPYADTGYDQIAIAKNVFHKNIRPTINRTCPAEVQKVINMCWDKQPSKRPNFNQIVELFDSMATARRPEGQVV